jgi:uncharacterized membrane protein
MNWRLRLRTQWHDLQSSLWFRPAAATVLAVLLAIGITTFDQLPYFTAPALLRIGVDSARTVLGVIAGAMLSVVGMIFSILMVVLVLASQQFSPRILRNFARDRISQNVLGFFIGTFTYSLLVLARISEHEDRVFTPVLSVTLAIVLALTAIGAFIYFIDHISKTIRASYIVADINRQTEAVLKKLHEIGAKAPAHDDHAQDDDEDAEAEPSWQAAEATVIRAPRAGNIQTVDAGALLNIAKEHGISIKAVHSVGDFVARDGALLVLVPGQKLSQELLDDLYGAFDIGTERTMFDDVLFGIRQLVDIALKAISPAVNDPTTAISAIDYLTNILMQAARQADVAERYRDEDGRVQLVVPRPTFTMMLELAFNQIRHYSRSEVTVTLRLLEALAEIAAATSDPERHAAIWRHAAMISRSVARNIHEPVERKAINDRLQEIAARCGGRLAGVELDNAKDPTEMVRRDEARDEDGEEKSVEESA